MHFMKILTVYTELTYTEPLKRISQKSYRLLSSAEIFEASLIKNVDPDQTTLLGAV